MGSSSFAYREHAFALVDGGDLQETLRAHPQTLRDCLDGTLHSRRADLEAAQLVVRERQGESSGFLVLDFEETQWLACRMETGRQTHQLRVEYRLEKDRLILKTLPREAFEDRVDEL